MAENFYKINNLDKAKKIYSKLSKWRGLSVVSIKANCKNFLKQKNKSEALKLLKKSYEGLQKKEIYETFDYAEFFKNNEKFEEFIPSH